MTDTANTKQLLTTDQVTDILQISPRMVRRLIATRALPAVQLGPRILRVTPEDLDAYIDANRKAA